MSVIQKRYQIFVSSTFADLKNEREKVIQVLMEMDCIPCGMELFPAMDEEQFSFIKRVIDDCDYYLLIIGNRYGSVTTDGVSYTEKEFDYAVSRGMKVLSFIHENPSLLPMSKSEKTDQGIRKLEKFRKKAQTSRLVKFWNTAEQLPGLVATSLNKTIKAYPAAGWVRGAVDNSSDSLISQVNSLMKKIGQDVGIRSIAESRKSFNNYFRHLSSYAKYSIDCVFVTGGFISGVDLYDIVGGLKHVKFNFYLVDPESGFRSDRKDDVDGLYPVGMPGDGYDEMIELSKIYPDRVRVLYYKNYPFWHYVMIDNERVFVSYNPIGDIGYVSSPVFEIVNLGDSQFSMFKMFRDNLRIMRKYSENIIYENGKIIRKSTDK